MSGKLVNRPYSASTAPNGRGTSRAAVAPNLPAEAFHTRKRRGANAPAPERNYVAIEMGAPAGRSIRNTVRTLKQRQAALSRRTARRGAIANVSMINKLRLRPKSKSRSKTPNRSYTSVYVRPNTPPPINVVVDPMNPPNNAVLQINDPPSRPRTPNNRITVVPHSARRPHRRIRVKSKSKSKSKSK
jgi:hypothetical protein